MGDTAYDTLVGLVSQYSPSGQERGAVEWLVRRMQSLGYDESFIDEAGNAVGMMGEGPGQVVLLGHIDTVPGEISVQVDNGVLYGRGSVDAKGPLACFVDAVAQVGARPGWQFVVIGAVEEERDSQGARFAATQYTPDLAIVGEPNKWDRMALGYKGSAWANITVQRAQAHSASGEGTAAEAAVALWLRLKTQVGLFNAEKQKAFDQLLLTLRGMASDSNDFEQWAQLQVGVRLPVEVSPEAWYQILEKILKGFGKDLAHERQETETFRVFSERTGFAVPAWSCEKNTRLVRAFLQGIRSQGGEPRFVYKTGTADLNIVAPVWQCPAVVYGPGDSTLDHTPVEHLALEEYATSVNVVCFVLQHLAAQPSLDG
jgi:LysW-gamma-L-lysine carboxypeptidase